jgi:hypothetical protein
MWGDGGCGGATCVYVWRIAVERFEAAEALGGRGARRGFFTRSLAQGRVGAACLWAGTERASALYL